MKRNEHFEKRLRERGIRREWCERAVSEPYRMEVQPENGRIRYWVFVLEMGSGGQWLRMVTEADGETPVTAHPDRRFRP